MGKGGKKCAVTSCANTDADHHMHTFPVVTDQPSLERCLTWIQNTGNESVLRQAPASLYKRRFVCGEHFDDNQYVNPAKRQRIKRNAVPTVLCPKPLSSELLGDYVSEHTPQFKDCFNLFTSSPSNNDSVERSDMGRSSSDLNSCVPFDHNNELGADEVSQPTSSVPVRLGVSYGNSSHESDNHLQSRENENLSSIAGSSSCQEYCSSVETFEMGDQSCTSSRNPATSICPNAISVRYGTCVMDHDYSRSTEAEFVNHEVRMVVTDVLFDDLSTGELEAVYFNDNVGITDVPCGMLSEEIVITNVTDFSVQKINQRIQRHCSVRGCDKNNLTHSMFSFPQVKRKVDGEYVVDDLWMNRCREWVKFCSNDKLSLIDLSLLHKKSYFVCAVHFKPDDLLNSRKLNRNAVPSLHGPDESLLPGVVDQGDIACTATEESVLGRFSKKLEDLNSERCKKFSMKFDKLIESFSWETCPVCQERYIVYPGIKRAHRNKGNCWKFSKRNNMDPGEIPEVLKDLTFIEEQLISRVHPVLSVHKLKGCQYGYKGNVINFSQDVQEFAKKLPHRIEDLKSILTVRFESKNGSICDFRVRAHKIRDALLWLKEHNAYYRDIEICSENIEDLPQDDNVFGRLSSLTLPGEEDDSDSDSDVDLDVGCKSSHVKSSGVPCNESYNQNDQLNAVLNWPEMSQDPVSESTPGFIMCAFPVLFPFGNCDLKDQREAEVKLHDYFKHFMSFADGRFANHPTFRFFAFNMWQRQTALSSGNVFMKKDPKLSNMNVDQLKEYLKLNPSYLKKMMFMGSNIRGSKSFWKSRCGELKDMVEQIGLPTIFLTMSAADMYWPDLFRLLTGKHVSSISMKERRRLVQENPLVVDMFFQYRLECFIEHVLQPKYQVVDYWYRIEYQHRGSPHVHGLFWLKDAPDISKYIDGSDDEKKRILQYFDKLVCAVNPSKDCPMPDAHPCEIKCGNVIDVETDLAQLLKKVQRHTRCSPEYCQRVDKKTNRTVCRFHFPIEIEPSSKIVTKTDLAEIEFAPERNDERLNKFNPFIISSWRANIDISPVLSKRAIIEYLAKYVSKSEIGSQTLKDITSSVCSSLDGGDNAKRAIQKILMKNCVQRDVSAQEVCHILMGLRLYSAGGRNFVVVYTNTSDWIPVTLTGEYGEGPEGGKVSGKTFMQKYCDRPKHMDSLSMWDAAKFYKVPSWRKCKKANIVRVFPRLALSNDEEKNEEFYRQKVLLFVPWRSELTLKGEDEKWRDVFDRHKLADMNISELNINLKESNHREDEFEEFSLDPGHECDEDWMIASRISAGCEVQGVELGRREVDLRYDWEESYKRYQVYGDTHYFQNFIQNEKKKDDGDIVSDDLPSVAFSDEQAAVKELMEKQIGVLQTGSTDHIPKRVLVQGKAGTGKSLLIKYLCQKLRNEFGEGCYLLLGPTGVAAINIGGATVHSALRIPAKKQNFKELKGDGARKFCDMIEHVKFIILDEYSMVGCTMLGMIDKRLREGTGVNEPFGGLYVYFFGDFKQLPPVKDVALFGGDCHGDLAHHGRNIFNSFESHFVLTKGHRQKDHKFVELLDRLSIGESTIEDYEILKTRFKTCVNRKEEENFDNAIRLFATKEGVASYNLQKLHNLKDENGNLIPVARIPAKHHGPGASSGSTDQADGLPSVMYLAKGSNIMLRSNLWVKRGLVNGSMGKVVDILYETGKEPPNESPNILMCKFENYSGPGIGPNNLVPIAPIVRSWTSVSGNQCSRQQFPVVLCYACSIHKSQGLTMNQAVIDIGSKEFALGLCYVGLSRVKTLEGLLLEPFSYQRLQQIKLKGQMLLRKNFEKKICGQ